MSFKMNLEKLCSTKLVDVVKEANPSVKKGKYYLRKKDAMIGTVAGAEFWIDRDLFEYWQYAHFTLDVIDGYGVGGFSLETSRQKTFRIIYRLFEEQELAGLEPVLRK